MTVDMMKMRKYYLSHIMMKPSVVSKSFCNLSSGETDDGAQVSSCSSSKVTIGTLLTSQVHGFPIDRAVNVFKIHSTI